MNELISDKGLWLERAKVAREAGMELAELARSLGTVVGFNYFGIGCEEGEYLYGELDALLASATTQLRSRAQDAQMLAELVDSASSELVHADGDSASTLATE